MTAPATWPVGETVVVFVPSQMWDPDGSPTFGPYWEGEVRAVADSPTGIRYTIAKPGFDDCVFHHKWVFPASAAEGFRRPKSWRPSA